uniref:IFN protein n=1 Tax=Malurus cyaneus samueli TaxID=2593467 RepID=A0A8C5X3W1_9PASS
LTIFRDIPPNSLQLSCTKEPKTGHTVPGRACKPQTQHLCFMGDSHFTLSLPPATAALFPDALRHNNLHPQQAAAAALRILQHLLPHPQRQQHPPPLAHQPRNDLLNQLQHHITTSSHASAIAPRSSRDPATQLLTINKYFRDIHLFLHAHNHSACAWDHVRVEARASLQHLHNLTRTMRR